MHMGVIADTEPKCIWAILNFQMHIDLMHTGNPNAYGQAVFTKCIWTNPSVTNRMHFEFRMHMGINLNELQMHDFAFGVIL